MKDVEIPEKVADIAVLTLEELNKLASFKNADLLHLAARALTEHAVEIASGKPWGDSATKSLDRLRTRAAKKGIRPSDYEDDFNTAALLMGGVVVRLHRKVVL